MVHTVFRNALQERPAVRAAGNAGIGTDAEGVEERDVGFVVWETEAGDGGAED